MTQQKEYDPHGMDPDADSAIADLARQEGRGPNIEELLGAIWTKFKGAKGIANALHNDYTESPVGSANRVRVMSDVMRLIHTCFSPTGKDEDRDLEAMEAELKAAVAELKAALAQQGG